MNQSNFLHGRKLGFLGVGNMNTAILRNLLEAKVVSPEDVYVTNRTEGRLKKIEQELGVKSFSNNEELIENTDILFIGVKPHDLDAAIEPIASSFHEQHIVLSLAAGVSLQSLSQLIRNTKNIIRLMPNTPVRVGEGVTGYSLNSEAESYEPLVQALLEPLGMAIRLEEGESFDAFTVACGSGPGFIFELMQVWQEWLEEYDFSPQEARELTVKTFKGSIQLAESQPNVSLEEMQKHVTSKKGGTAEGLEAMREQELERIIRVSFERAFMRFQEIGRSSL